MQLRLARMCRRVRTTESTSARSSADNDCQLFPRGADRERGKSSFWTHRGHLGGETGRHPERTALSAWDPSSGRHHIPDPAPACGRRRDGSCGRRRRSSRVQRRRRPGRGRGRTGCGSRRERRRRARPERRERRDCRPVGRCPLPTIVARRAAVAVRAGRELPDRLLGQHGRRLVHVLCCCPSVHRSGSVCARRRLCQRCAGAVEAR